MADVPTLKFSSLQKYLRKFEQKLKPVLKACNVEFNSDFSLKKTHPNKFQLLKFAKFVGVQQRAGNRQGKARLNIFLHFEGELDDQDRVIKYRIRVSYTLVKIQARPREICLVRGIHYDFNSASEPLHPICHAQEDITTLKDEIGEDNYDILNAEQIDEFQKKCLFAVKSARIPTAFFDFFSVVIMVVADHCVKKDMPEQVKSFNEILNFVIEELPEISISTDLLPNRSTLTNTNIAKLHSAHWYAAGSLQGFSA